MKVTYENGKEKKNEKSAKTMKKLKIRKFNNKIKSYILTIIYIIRYTIIINYFFILF